MMSQNVDCLHTEKTSVMASICLMLRLIGLEKWIQIAGLPSISLVLEKHQRKSGKIIVNA